MQESMDKRRKGLEDWEERRNRKTGHSSMIGTSTLRTAEEAAVCLARSPSQ